MALLTGPLMSLDASGTIGDTITYAKWKGRNYARTRVIPSNPKSASQTGMRSMFSFLTKQWDSLSSNDQATYDEAAEAKSISSFNEYISYNMARWKNYSPPSQAKPAAEASTPLTVSDMTLTGGEAHVNISLTPSGSTDIWGFEIYRSDAEITNPNNSNCIAVIEADGANAVEYNDTGLEAGTYHYRAAVINTDGIRGTVIADDSEAAT
jgi:hypothetical protein